MKNIIFKPDIQFVFYLFATNKFTKFFFFMKKNFNTHKKNVCVEIFKAEYGFNNNNKIVTLKILLKYILF